MDCEEGEGFAGLLVVVVYLYDSLLCGGAPQNFVRRISHWHADLKPL
jgi:hypothetical protein